METLDCSEEKNILATSEVILTLMSSLSQLKHLWQQKYEKTEALQLFDETRTWQNMSTEGLTTQLYEQ